ncbi:hypothetical protein B0H14DRAFT_3453728 [Mycena olivaceomarginata]|nr:hypothetical protein B0H14DRAFT_3453728 [Mycena olivaceomarginata]
MSPIRLQASARPLVLGRRCHATVAHENGAARTRPEPAPAPAARCPPSSCPCPVRLALACDTARSLSVHISTAHAPAFASAFASTLPARVHASTHTFPSSADYARPPSRLAWPSFRIEHIHRTGTPPPRPQASAWHIQLLPRAVPRVAASHTTEAIRFDPSCASAHTHTRARICALNAPLHMRMLPCILRALSFGPWHTSPSETSIPHTAGAPPDSQRRRRVHVGKEKRHKE